MPIYTKGGSVLAAGRGVAGSPNCCCGGDCVCTGAFETWQAFFNSSDGKWYSKKIENGCTFSSTYENEVPEGTRFNANTTTITVCSTFHGGPVQCSFVVNPSTCLKEFVEGSCSGEILNVFNQCFMGCEDNDPEGFCSVYCFDGPGVAAGLITTTALSDPCTLPAGAFLPPP
jgi:hypothetical protein